MAKPDQRALEMIGVGDRLFAARDPLPSYWQEIAEQFYPERANFTTTITMGEDFYAHLMDSYPVQLRRELGNAISAMLRPRDRPWFRGSTGLTDLDEDDSVAKFLEYLSERQRRALYDSRTKFIGATKMGDHDFITFGNAVISLDEDPTRTHLYFDNHHLNDCAWQDNAIGDVDILHRKRQMTAYQMKRVFGEKNLAEPVKRACKDGPHTPFNVRCIVMPRDVYDYVGTDSDTPSKRGQGKRLPFVRIWIDADNQKVLREGGLPDFNYVVPRWHRVSNWAYAFSPATAVALPDGRLSQQLARIILESGEKAIDPPMVAREEAVVEANLAAGAITWIDSAYDEKLGDPFHPVDLSPDMRTAFAMREDLRAVLTKSFFLDKLNLPSSEGKEMTAYEVSRRLEEYVRSALPLFEPMEVEYNTRLLDKSFAYLANMNAFDFSQMPDALKGREMVWRFESPIQSAATKLKVSQFAEVMQLRIGALQAGATQDPLDVNIAYREAARASGAPAGWFKPLDQILEEAQAAAEEAEIMKGIGQIGAGAEVANKVGDAAGKLRDGLDGLPPGALNKMLALPPPSPRGGQ